MVFFVSNLIPPLTGVQLFAGEAEIGIGDEDGVDVEGQKLRVFRHHVRGSLALNPNSPLANQNICAKFVFLRVQGLAVLQMAQWF